MHRAKWTPQPVTSSGEVASLNRGKPHEASQFSRVRCDLAETRAASGALVSQRNIDTIFLVRMSLHKPFNQLVLEYSINVRFI
jgi:hypothetical protein